MVFVVATVVLFQEGEQGGFSGFDAGEGVFDGFLSAAAAAAAAAAVVRRRGGGAAVGGA